MQHLAFPFPAYRQGQREALDEAREAYANGTRFVVIEAPTGSGKSAIAVTLAREAGSAYVLTAQKLLQDQYLRDFPDLAIMKGRANYPCLVAPTHAAAAPCIAGRRFTQCEDCPYFTAKDIAIAANGVILNYAYYLAELNLSGGFGPRELLVLDEAHNAEAALMNFVQLTLSDVALTRAGIPERIPHVIDEEEYFEFLEDLLPLLRSRARELEADLRSDSGPKVGSDLAGALLQTKSWLDTQAVRVQGVIASRDEHDVEWTVERSSGSDGQSVVFKPVRVAPFARDVLFRFGERVLMLSATILDAETYARSLGIEPEELHVIRVPSDFPPENRPIRVRPVARMTRHHVDAALPKLLHAVVDLFESHPYEKGIVHAHSYKIASYLAKGLPASLRDRLVTHYGPDGREAALERHVRSPQPTVLVTPSMTEGVDLADDLSRWQVICKIPYPYLGDPQIARRQALDPAWYEWRTCLTVVQAYGRSVRSRDDHAVTYVLDADFPAFVRRQRRRLPDWFLEALEE